MQKKSILITISIIILVLLLGATLFLLNKQNKSSQPRLANPASVYCDEHGGKLEIRKDDQGGEVGICFFKDGSECEEWAYFRSQCDPGGQESKKSREDKSEVQISENEEKSFSEKLKKNYSGKKLKNILQDLVILKEKYPAGYFTVIKVGSKSFKNVKKFYDLSIKEQSSRLNLLVHELVHVGSQPCFLYGQEDVDDCEMDNVGGKIGILYKDTGIILKNFDLGALFDKGKIRSLAKDVGAGSGEFDDIYLADEAGAIEGTLDELNAYTRSLEIEIAFKENDGLIIQDYFNVLRQIYHLNLYLKYAKNNDPGVWKKLVKNKSWAVLIKKLRVEADNVLAQVNLDKLNKNEMQDDQETLEAIKKTKAEIEKLDLIFNEYIKQARIGDDWKKDWKNLQVEGMEVVKVK